MPPENRITIDNAGHIRQQLKEGVDCYIFYKIGNRYKVNNTAIAEASKSGFALPLPFRKENDVPVQPGTSFLFKINIDNGSLEFSSQCKVIFSKGPKTYIRLAYPSTIIRTQRRQAYRVSTSLIGEIQMQHGQSLVALEKNITILDLSLAGALVAVNTPLITGTLGVLEFRIPLLADPILIDFQVQREKRGQNIQSKHQHQFGLRFEPLPPTLETILARYINERQVHTRTRERESAGRILEEES